MMPARTTITSTITKYVAQRRCRALHCPYCLPLQVRDVARAIALAEPDWFLTLTLVGSDFTTIRDRMNRYRQKLLRAGTSFEWVWHVEHNPEGNGAHVHAWVRCEVPPSPSELSLAAQASGLGPISDWQRRRAEMGPRGLSLDGVTAASYGMKEALEGLASDVSLTMAQEAFLALNGGRLCHASRQFWVDRYGRPLPGVRAAIRQARWLSGGSS